MAIQPSQKLSPSAVFGRQTVPCPSVSRFFVGVDFMILSNPMTLLRL
jgi:hypothetical protein